MICFIFPISATSMPGRVTIWDSNHAEQSSIKYNSKSLNSKQVVELISDLSHNYEAVVLLTASTTLRPDTDAALPQNSLLSNEVVEKSIKASRNAQVLTTVYKAKPTDRSITENVLAMLSHDTTFVQQFKHPNEFLNTISNSNVLKNGKIDPIQITIDTTDASAQQSLSDLLALTHPSGKVLYITISEPTLNGIAPTENGMYTRSLGSANGANSVTANQRGVSKKPLTDAPVVPNTGAEFSIYYVGTYLYITPDIFTGIMTALFLFFVLLTGYSCMGSIQGMSSFYDKVPSNGKEA